MSTLIHRCPATGCRKVVDNKYLMCRAHWRMVPVELQRAVWSAYHRWEHKPTDEHLEALRKAQQAAIEAVNATLRGVPA